MFKHPETIPTLQYHCKRMLETYHDLKQNGAQAGVEWRDMALMLDKYIKADWDEVLNLMGNVFVGSDIPPLVGTEDEYPVMYALSCILANRVLSSLSEGQSSEVAKQLRKRYLTRDFWQGTEALIHMTYQLGRAVALWEAQGGETA